MRMRFRPSQCRTNLQGYRNPVPAGVEPKASPQESQQQFAASASDPEVKAHLAATAVTAISKEITPINNPNEPVAAPDASEEVPSPAPALTSAAKDGTTEMEKNPAFGAAVPSVAGPTVIEASLPVTQTAGTLGDLADILESEIQVVSITSNSARVIAQTTVDVACAVAFGKTLITVIWPSTPTWAAGDMPTTGLS